MNRFYIEKLVVSGGGCKTTVIDFQPGLNFILGPSNTGKSLIMDCIDYVFGFTPRKSHPSKIVDNNYGWQTWSLYVVSASAFNEDAARFYLNFHCRLTDHPVSLQPV